MFIYSACENSSLCQVKLSSMTSSNNAIYVANEEVTFFLDGKAVTSPTTLTDGTVVTYIRNIHPLYVLAVHNDSTTSSHYIGIRTEADVVILIVNAFMAGAIVEIPNLDLTSVPTVLWGDAGVFPLQISTEFVYYSDEVSCESTNHDDCIRITPVNFNTPIKKFGLQITAIPIRI